MPLKEKPLKEKRRNRSPSAPSDDLGDGLRKPDAPRGQIITAGVRAPLGREWMFEVRGGQRVRNVDVLPVAEQHASSPAVPPQIR
jgi:hypothetical protein